MMARISGLNPKGPYLSLEKEKETLTGDLQNKRIFLKGRVPQAFVSAAPSQANYLIEYCIY